MSDKKYREQALARRAGMTEDAKERLETVNAAATWTAKCRVCGAVLEGTPAQLKAHTHGG